MTVKGAAKLIFLKLFVWVFFFLLWLDKPLRVTGFCVARATSRTNNMMIFPPSLI